MRSDAGLREYRLLSGVPEGVRGVSVRLFVFMQRFSSLAQSDDRPGVCGKSPHAAGRDFYGSAEELPFKTSAVFPVRHICPGDVAERPLFRQI